MGKRGPQRRPLAERFWARVDVRGPDECWPWIGYLDADGYGQIAEGGRCSEPLATHRVAWEQVNGPIPDGMDICHSCDNPPCCNPAHLFPGTHDDNMADMKAKGRANGGPGLLTTALQFVQSYSDRHGTTRHYFRRKGQPRTALPGEPESVEFMTAYRAALEHRTLSERV